MHTKSCGESNTVFSPSNRESIIRCRRSFIEALFDGEERRYSKYVRTDFQGRLSLCEIQSVGIWSQLRCVVSVVNL